MIGYDPLHTDTKLDFIHSLIHTLIHSFTLLLGGPLTVCLFLIAYWKIFSAQVVYGTYHFWTVSFSVDLTSVIREFSRFKSANTCIVLWYRTSVRSCNDIISLSIAWWAPDVWCNPIGILGCPLFEMQLTWVDKLVRYGMLFWIDLSVEHYNIAQRLVK